jgi:hypothetical protein
VVINLHSLVKRTADDHPDIADPGELSEKVFSRIGPEDYADTIKTMIREYVRHVVNETRNLPAGQSTNDAQATSARRTSSVGNHVRAMQAGAWKERLKDRYHTPDGWKFLREMTSDDLKFAAGARRELAKENVAVAASLDKLRTVLTKHHATTVGELPDRALETVLNA